MLRKPVLILLFAIIICGSFVIAQYERDEVLQITYPTTGTVIDADTMTVTFDIASYFALGDTGCANCDGYLVASLNGLPVGTVHADEPFVVRDLTDGYYLFMLEAVDPSGNSFLPAVWDTVSISVMYEEGFCPPTDLSVSSVVEYGNLVLNWRSPMAISDLAGLDENFDDGLPAEWEIVDGGTSADTWFWTTDDAGNTLDGTPFLFVDSDAAGIGVTLDEELITPSIASAGAASLNLIFDHYYNNYVGSETGDVDVWDGSAWITVATFEDVDYGTWTLPDHQVIDISAYANNDLKVRFHYYNADWDFYWAVDNVIITAEVVRGTWVYVYNLTPDGWAAQQMTKDEYGTTYPNGLATEEMIDMSTLERIDISLREDILSCGNLVGYDVFRGDSLIDNVDTTHYLDADVNLGTEYCYYIEAVYDSSNTGTLVNSDTSNNACGTPELYTPMPVTNLSATALDEQVYLDWTSPDVMQLGVPYAEEFDSDLLDLWSWEGDNWSIYGLDGNPAPCARFSWTPSLDFYDYSLYSPIIPLDALTEVQFSYDLELDDFGNTGTEFMTLEYYANNTWNMIHEYSNTADIAWSTYTATISGLTGTFQVRFRAHGDDSFQIDNWNIDNVALAEVVTNRDISGSSVEALSGYISGSGSLIEFELSVTSSDASECDSFAVTFPNGVTILDAGPDLLDGMFDGEPFNGIDGQTISWGSNRDDTFGGIYGTLSFWAFIVFEDSLSGPVTCEYHFSDDGDATIADADGTFEIPERVLVEGEFIGYNVYIDGSVSAENLYPLLMPGYMVNQLTNDVSYDFGVTAIYYPEYESVPVTISSTPVWLYGDITGVITDPAGNLLDSAVVKAGALVDTTDVDGVYFLKNLNPGVHAVSVSRAGFDGSLEDATIIAQEAATVLDFMMIPKLGKPRGLVAYGGNLEVDLAWNSPGAIPTGDWMFFHDGTFENAFSATSGGMGLAQLFVPASYPATIQAVRFHTSDFGSPTQNEEVWVFADDGVTVLSGPYVLPGVSNDWIEIDIDDATIESGGFLVATYNILAGGPYISVDDSYYDGSLFFGNAADGWDELGSLGYFYVGSHEALIAAAGGRSVTTAGDVANSAKTILRNEQLVGQWTAAGLHGESALRLPNVLRTTNTRTDSLIGYHIYQELTDGDSLVGVNAGNDTTTTIDVPANYVEYCFTVKAVWDTDVYDTLDSKASNTACAETFMFGDVDFIDGVTLIDLLMVVDFALEITTPSADQLRGADLNRDGMINIQDIIMIVDIIIPPTTARVSSDAATEAIIELIFDGQQNLTALLDYDGIVRGSQFTIRYDATNLELSSPRLSASAEGLVVNYNESEPGILNIVIADISGGSISYANGKLMTIPVNFKGNNLLSTIVALDESILVGANGESIPVLTKSASLDVRALPTQYALHQNYPNPFNPDTEIMFDLPEAGQVELVIYNLMGQKVATLVSNEMVGGYHKIRWNGLSDNGSAVATGMYFYQISSPNFHATRKMVLLK